MKALPHWLLAGFVAGACQAPNPAFHLPGQIPPDSGLVAHDAATSDVPVQMSGEADQRLPVTPVPSPPGRDAPPPAPVPDAAQGILPDSPPLAIDSAPPLDLRLSALDVAAPPPDLQNLSTDTFIPPRVPTALASLLVWMPMDEGKGLVAADNILPASSGTLNGGTMWAPGRLPGSNCLQFDGRDDHVEIDWKEKLTLPDSKTVSVWFQTTSPLVNSVQNIFSLTNSRVEAGFQIGYKGMNIVLWHWNGPSITATPAPLPGWHHLAISQQGAQFILYLDGREVTRGAYTFANVAPTQAALGAYFAVGGGTAEMYAGRLDDFRIYGRALTAGEIAQIANGD